MKKEKRVLYGIGILLMGCLALAVWAADTDTDGMTDEYEVFFGLNHTNAADAAFDPDGDSLTNLQESVFWTDPLAIDTDRDGWADNIDNNPLSRAVFLWGISPFCAGDNYLYTGPAWWGDTFKDGGLWTTNGWEAPATLGNNTGSLNIGVLRNLLTHDVVLDVELFDAANASLYAALCDTNQSVIVSNLYGQSLVTGSDQIVTRRLSIPLSSYSNAAIVRLWRGTGDITVYSSRMYIDADGDGLDADQELQAGTSDTEPDSDNDGLNDWAELFLTETDPLASDSDGDGYDDQAETIAESNPNDAQSLPPYAGTVFELPFTETFEADSTVAGGLHGQRGWIVAGSGSATVQSNDVFGGEQALEVTDASVIHEFDDGRTSVWVSYRLKMVRGAPLNIPDDMAVVFYVNSDGYLCAYSNQQSITLPVEVSEGWNRIDIHADYTAKRWELRLNRELVVNGFEFYGDCDAFSILRLDGQSSTPSYMDDVKVVFENPDRDGDGYTNEEEMVAGTDPDHAKSLPPYPSALPFAETFEASDEMAGMLGTLHGQHGWGVNGEGTAIVQSNDVFGGEQALEISAASVFHEFDDGRTSVWVSYRLKMVRGAPLNIPDDMAVVFHVNSDGYLCAYSNQQSITLPVEVSEGWNRIDIHADYTAKRWELRLNRELVVNGFEFYGEPDVFSILRLDAKGSVSSYMDDVKIVFENPDTDGDGYTDAEEIEEGSDPYDPASIPASAGSVSGIVSYDGLQSGTIRVVAVTASDEWNSAIGGELSGFGAYNITNVPVLANVWIKAWVDSNGNSLRDTWEASAEAGPFFLRVPVETDLSLKDPDADGDGLIDAIELYGRIYQAIPGEFTWEEAKADAERLGGHLATITSEQEQNILFQCVGQQAFYDHHLWIGAENSGEDGSWSWMTGEVFETTRWGREERPLAGADRAVIYHNWFTRNHEGQLWWDVSKYDRYGYLLEVAVSLDPLNSDTDGDGVNDFDEIRSGANPMLADTDGDGISDADEIAVGMNPAQLDSDSDGLSDAKEWVGPTDPVNPDTDGDGLMDGPELYGTLYLPVYEMLNWHEAKAHAESLGGHLATLTTPEENQNVIRTLGSTVLSRYNFWLGASDEETEGVWQWITGEPFETTQWSSAAFVMVFDDASTQDFLMTYPASDVWWNDGDNSRPRPFILEIPGTLDPLNPDSDGDGLYDGEEISITLTDPLSSPESVPDAVLSFSVSGAESHSRVLVDNYTEYFEDGSDLIIAHLVGDPFVTWTVTNQTAGMVRLALQIEPYHYSLPKHSRYPVEVSINGQVIGETLALIDCGDLAEGFIYTPWLESGIYEITCRFKQFVPPLGQDVRIHALELYAIAGADVDGNGIADWIDARLNAGLDTDGDGLTDQEELNLGTDSLNADTDGDGMVDSDELAAGTDPLDRDTDGDGIDDWTEKNQALTDLLAADFGQRTDVLVLNGSQIIGSTGRWVQEGTVIYSTGLNGSLTYTLNVPSNGHYAVDFEIADHSAFPESDPFDLTLSVDGVAGRPVAVRVPEGQSANALFFAPYLDAGEHMFTLRWENLNASQMLEVRSVRLVSYSGDDADGNGQADWMDTREANGFNLLDRGFRSPVSPVCIEGSSLFSDLLAISNSFTLVDSSNHWVAAQSSINWGWYGNGVLAPWEETQFTFTHNGVFDEQSLTLEWEETNLMTTPTNQTTVREGDALLFNALPDGIRQGSIIITVDGPEGITNLVSLTDQPIPHIFEEAGTYTVSGFFSRSRAVHFDENDPVNAYGFHSGTPADGVFNDGNTSTSEVFTVEVVDIRFADEPSCIIDHERFWDCPDIPQGTVVEKDESLGLSSLPLEGGGTLFRLVSFVEEEQGVIARLFEDGPITDHARVNTIVQQYAEFYRVIEEFSDGSSLIELTIAFSNIPDDFRLELEIFTGGVTFLDGTVTKTFTKDDFSEEGVLKVQMLQSFGKDNDCHSVKIFQGDRQL